MCKRFLAPLFLLLGGLAAQPVDTPAEYGLAGYAKVLCSAVFVSYRDPAEARKKWSG